MLSSSRPSNFQNYLVYFFVQTYETLYLFLLYAIYFIYKCKIHEINPSRVHLKSAVDFILSVEKLIAFKKHSLHMYNKLKDIAKGLNDSI